MKHQDLKYFQDIKMSKGKYCLEKQILNAFSSLDSVKNYFISQSLIQNTKILFLMLNINFANTF